MRLLLASALTLAGWLSSAVAASEPSRGPLVRRLRDGAAVELHPWHAGHEVLARPITLRLDERGRVRWTHGDVPPLAGALEPGHLLGADEIVSLLAENPALPRAARIARGPEPIVFAPPSRAPRLAYWLRFAHDQGTNRTLELVVDAKSGAILSVDDEVRFDRLARVFRENPVATPDPEVVLLDSLPRGAPQLDGPDLFARGCVDLGRCRQVEGGWIHGCDPVATALADGAGDFLAYDRPGDDASPDDPAAEVQIYHHAARALDAFRAFSGDPSFTLSTRPMQLLANVRLSDLGDPAVWCDGPDHPEPPELVPLDFAFYTPEGTWGTDAPTEMLVFGQGTALDLSYDGDVVSHELTHAVIHAVSDIGWTVPDSSGMDLSQYAMDEGFADYFAAAISGDPEIAEYAAPAFAGPARSLEEDRACPRDLTGESHDDSRIWSSALWEIRDGLADDDRAAMDASVFTVVASLGSWDTFDSARTLVVDELRVSIGGAAADLAASVLETRGLDGCNARVQTVELDEARSALYVWGTDRFALDPLIPAAVQLRVELEADASEIQVQIDESAPIVTGPSGVPGEDREPDVWLLVKPGTEAIEWTWEPVGGHDALLEAPVTFSDAPGRPGSGSIAGPFPAGVYHLQLANAGDGWEARGVRIRATRSTDGDAGPDSGELGPAVGGGGCGCRAPGGLAATAWPVLPIAAKTLLRRRRTSRSRVRF
ncbi:MAG: hypothetical protein HYY06_18715 [Deltaproteobacteria bacterium]|nr:hypothetical protein [Deltaproteobacteria bacterium]